MYYKLPVLFKTNKIMLEKFYKNIDLTQINESLLEWIVKRKDDDTNLFFYLSN